MELKFHSWTITGWEQNPGTFISIENGAWQISCAYYRCKKKKNCVDPSDFSPQKFKSPKQLTLVFPMQYDYSFIAVISHMCFQCAVLFTKDNFLQLSDQTQCMAS